MNMKRKLIPALAMLLISATMLTSASFAWFSMNSEVKATGMQVQATAEQGILIAPNGTESWGASAEALTSTATLLPTSTSDFTNWYTNTSKDPAAANAGTSGTTNGASKILDIVDSTGIGVSNKKNYYLKNTFKIKASGTENFSTKLYIKSVSVTTGTKGTTELNGAVRVGVKCGSFLTIYGSTSKSTSSYYVGNQKSTATEINAYNTANTEITGIESISPSLPSIIDVYVWYEGEDAACISNNILGKTVDNMKVDVTFSTTTSG